MTETVDNPIGRTKVPIDVQLGDADVSEATPVDFETTAEWIRKLDPAKREAIRKLHTLLPVWNWVILLYPVVIGLTLWVLATHTSWSVRIPCYIVIGVAINSMVVLMHEACHYGLFRNRSLDRFVGFFMGAPVLVSVSAYRVVHGYHHRYTRGSEDPDEYLNLTNHKWLLAIFFYLWPIIGTPILILHIPVNAFFRAKGKDVRDCIVEYVLIVLLWSGIVLIAWRAGRMDMLLHGWVFPMVVLSMLTNIRGWSEHAMTDPNHPLLRTRTVTSNPVVSFLMCNLNYHIEHHIFPGVPWYNLDRVHKILEDEYREAEAFVCKSYVLFTLRALRTGVHGMTHLPTM